MEQKKVKIVAAGHICLDITPKFQNQKTDTVSCLLKPGGLLNVGAADIHIGGSVANTGLGMKLLGADVSFMGKIGADDFGRIVKAQLADYGASAAHMIESPQTDTSYSIVIAPVGMDRMFLHHPGANADFTMEDLDYDLIREADLFHFGYPPLMKRMYENRGEELVRMFRKVSSMGVATSLDTASIDENSEAGQTDWQEVLQRVLPYVDFFVPSVEELAYMTDRPLYQRWQERAAGGEITDVVQTEEVAALADRMISWGAHMVLIKCGAPGMFLAADYKKNLEKVSEKTGIDLSGWANVRHFENSYQPTRLRSATGAGDTSIAAFLYGVLNGCTWEETMRYTTATGASCVEEYDAVSGLKTFDQLKARIDGGWKKLTAQ